MDSNTVCVRPNITERGRQMRMVLGVVATAAALGLAHMLKAPDIDRWMRLFVGVPLFFGVLGLLQAREKT